MRLVIVSFFTHWLDLFLQERKTHFVLGKESKLLILIQWGITWCGWTERQQFQFRSDLYFLLNIKRTTYIYNHILFIDLPQIANLELAPRATSFLIGTVAQLKRENPWKRGCQIAPVSKNAILCNKGRNIYSTNYQAYRNGIFPADQSLGTFFCTNRCEVPRESGKLEAL